MSQMLLLSCAHMGKTEGGTCVYACVCVYACNRGGWGGNLESGLETHVNFDMLLNSFGGIVLDGCLWICISDIRRLSWRYCLGRKCTELAFHNAWKNEFIWDHTYKREIEKSTMVSEKL